ncbi:hypothetical protein FHR20_001178 [Sphingomonas leidyi]|uniref:Uncharacterized protein n=1 Tax=Sphingomonas leidyi TaxID=68569 RepID=A0A7X5UZ33_9SPHN|nr:DUF6493 family protein [Sphingomonas leidyi]NIJ64247.1 hypothetical protein [Sphingomonas leidyi]
MTYDELEALVLDPKDGWALQRALAPLDEKARAKLSAPVQKLYKQLYSSVTDKDASDRLKAILASRKGDKWNYWNAAETRHAMLALFAVGPLSIVKKRQVHVWHEQVPLLDRILRDRRPAWLNEWIAHELEAEFTHLNFAALREWIRDGVCAKPEVDGYYRMFAGYLMRTGFYHKNEVVPPITTQLLADPDLLADVEGLFRVESIAFNTNAWLTKGAASDYETWTEALLKLSAEGHLDRAALLQWALDGLKLDFKQNQLSGFHGFYKKMGPSEAELRRHQSDYIDLLCHPVGHVVKFAIEMLSEVEKKSALDIDPVLRELPLVLSSDGKGNAVAALKLLKRIIARQKRHARAALSVVGEALQHAQADVQALALDILGANAAQLASEDLANLRDREPFVAASNRARFAQLVTTNDQDSADPEAGGTEPGGLVAEATETRFDYHPIASDRLAEPILLPEDKIAPIETAEALIEAVLHAVETVDSPDEVERIIDAISRLANDRPTDFDAKVAPLLHRLKTGRGTASIVLGTVGVGGALLDLLYTWLTGRLYRTPGEESQYYTLEDGFVPVRAHLRAIAEAIHRGERRPLLSAPTHKGGWIDPLVWVERLIQAHGGASADSMDFRLSLLRLAPDHRREALERAVGLPAPLRGIVDFALGGEARLARSDRSHSAAWITAARCRDPYRDWTEELAPLNLDDALPDGVRPARYIWRSSHKAHQYDRTRWKIPEFTISVTCEGRDEAAERRAGLLGRVTAAFGARTRADWSELPTAALNRRMDTKRYWSGEMNSPWVAHWLAFVWPQNPAATCMRGVTRLMLRTDDNSSSWTPSHGYFQPLFQHGRPWREAGHLLLCLGLVGKDADAGGLAVDALIDGIDARLFDPELFASMMARLAEGEWIKLNRLGDALMQVVQISPLHAKVISDALQLWLPKLDFGANNAFRLLEVIVEARAITGQALAEEARDVLLTATGKGKFAKVAKLLAEAGHS